MAELAALEAVILLKFLTKFSPKERKFWA